MKLAKSEKAALLVLAGCLLFTAGFLVGKSTVRAAVRIESSLDAAPVQSGGSLPEEENPATEEPVQNAAAVNINTATAEELTALPGIGTVLAERIVAYRTEHGLFGCREDICRVAGIGSQIYEEIENLICV